MKNAKIKHYAKALVETGKENSCFAELIADIEHVSEKFNETLEYKSYFGDKHLSMSQKKAALKKVFGDFISLKTYNFILLLIKEKKLDYLDTILESAKKVNMEDDGVLQVHVESAIAISPAQGKKLESMLSERYGQPVVMKNIVNSEVLGGIKLKVEDTEIDSTISGKISRLRKMIQELR
jgi:F-type H+-transporting ATPase subunit delta